MPDPIGGFPPDPYRPVVRPMFRTLAIASSGLSAQRVRIETVATNIANAETTRAADGTPYRRRVVRMEAGEIPGQPFELGPDGLPALGRLPGGDVGFPAEGREAAWHADPLVEPGGVVVEGRDRIIDGRVDTALERVYRRLTYTS